MTAVENRTLTAVPGINVGHAATADGRSGCTVILGPFRATCDVRGLATGTRELGVLEPTHLVSHVDAVLLTGGSAYGLAAADGVMQWLAEHGRGFDTGGARVPIVPAAVIYDLKPEFLSPDALVGRAVCAAATNDAVLQGRVGAGTGATIGKLRGVEYADSGGTGSYAQRAGRYTVGAIVVVNALGDVIADDGSIVAGARNDQGSFVDSLRALAVEAPAAKFAPTTANTTLALVATDAPLTRTALQAVARASSCAIVRRIAPANTLFDGDVVFAVSTSEETRELPPAELLSLGAAAQLVLERAILNAARGGQS